jgi:hypothetical protein
MTALPTSGDKDGVGPAFRLRRMVNGPFEGSAALTHVSAAFHVSFHFTHTVLRFT